MEAHLALLSALGHELKKPIWMSHRTKRAGSAWYLADARCSNLVLAHGLNHRNEEANDVLLAVTAEALVHPTPSRHQRGSGAPPSTQRSTRCRQQAHRALIIAAGGLPFRGSASGVRTEPRGHGRNA